MVKLAIVGILAVVAGIAMLVPADRLDKEAREGVLGGCGFLAGLAIVFA